ncbi:MAG: hypothetical protein SO362_06105 [Selenomonas montiformis]|uniref:hypothetical protein n=1 Tax=Selenomonas montiformis TaxID=2652285 RepID=UPI0012B524FE|nr:hypothetical protein [Selenomonas montiformis]MDY4697442.1 hypothetical protein [Selenomonas montiformis]
MYDMKKILIQKLDSIEFQAAWEKSSMAYDFMERIADVCTKLASDTAADKH